MAEMMFTPLAVGTVVLDRYRIVSIVGRGGLGTVYKVADRLFTEGNVYALKELADTSPGARKQFELESQWLQSLNHPNIPKFREHFEWHDRLYLVMDFVTGENLEQRLARLGGRGVPEQQTVAWILPTCDALHYLHTRMPPILHRDLKPANIIVTPAGHPVLVDLGIAKEHLPGAGLTATFVRKAGTEGYAPPEQYTTNGQTGPWSDVYGIGATMYHLLTGCVPPTAVDRVALDAKLIHPRDINHSISPQVDAAVCRALALRPAERYRSVLEFSQALMGVAPAPFVNSAPRMGQSPASAIQTPAPRVSAFPTPNPGLRAGAKPRTGGPVPGGQLERRVSEPQLLQPSPDGQHSAAPTPHKLFTMPRLLIALATLLVLLAVGGGAVLLLNSSPLDRSSPSATVTGYYNALKSQDYARAWQYTENSRNNVGAQSQDVNRLRADDALSGKVLSVTISQVQDPGTGQATVLVSVTRAASGGTVISDTISLTQFDGNTWLITSVTSS